MNIFKNTISIKPIEIIFSNHIYDDWVKDFFPRFQESNRLNKNENIIIDFSDCEWISPLQLLLVATEIMTYSQPEREIIVNLGTGSGTDKGATARSRVLKYLAKNGFIEIFLSRSDLNFYYQYDTTGESGTDGKWFSNSNDIRKLKIILERTNVELVYGESIVLPAQVWKLPKTSDGDVTEKLRIKTKEILKHADSTLFNFKTESRKYRDVTLQRLTQILLELVENSAEHAYDENIIGFIGIYARIRHFDNIDAIDIRGRELGNSPLLKKVLLNSKQKQIEIFVVDVGRGLFYDIHSWPQIEQSKISVQPLRQTAGILFIKPMSRHNRKIEAVSRVRGSSTGLVHLDAILRHQNDSTRIVTGNEWLAGAHPRPPGFQDNAVTTGGYFQQNDKIHGTIFHIGLSPSVIPDLNTQWFTSDKPSSSQVRDSIIKKLVKTRVRFTLDSNIIDIRGGEGLESVQARVRNLSIIRSGVVIRVNRIIEKNLVNQVVISWIQGCASAGRQASNLFLCDLGRYQAVDTLWVIEHLFSHSYRIDLAGNAPVGLSIF